MYFKYDNGKYIEDENGILCGIKGADSNGNNFIAVFFMPQFTSLQMGQEVQWIYTVHVTPVGLANSTQIRNETVTVSNSTLVNRETGEVVEPEPEPEPELSKEGETRKKDPSLVGQLDYYVNAVCKGIGDRVILYDDMIKVMIERETQNLPGVTFKA
jgi:hypothetical protein